MNVVSGCILSPNTAAATATAASSEYWDKAYGASQYPLTDNAKTLFSKFFDCVCGVLGLNTASRPLAARRQMGELSGSVRRLCTSSNAIWRTTGRIEIFFCSRSCIPTVSKLPEKTGNTPFDLVPKRHSPNNTLSGTSDGSAILASDGLFRPVHYKRRYSGTPLCHKVGWAQADCSMEKVQEELRRDDPMLEKGEAV